MKKANQSQVDTDIEDRNYKSTKERPPRQDLRRDSAPVRDDEGGAQDAIQKRKDLGGTSVYEKQAPSGGKKAAPQQDETSQQGQSGRSMQGFVPTKDNLERLLGVETKLDVTMKFLSAAMAEFTTLKSIDISPDGKLGGRGFVMDISEVRNRLYASVESLSSVIDTLYDETRGDHWKAFFDKGLVDDPKTTHDETENRTDEPLDEETAEPLTDDEQESESAPDRVASILQRVIKKANAKKE